MKVVITGTAQGIGLKTALKFLNEGHTVIGIDIKPMPKELRGFPFYTHYEADVSDRSQLPPINGVEVLINNAGVQDELLNLPVNLMGVINCCEQYAFNKRIKSVVNVASVSAHNGAEFPLYTASKGGVLAYTKWLAQEIIKYSSHAIANSISPGGVLTPMTEDIYHDNFKRQLVFNETLLGKWASANEIAQWIYFVAVVNKSMTAQDIIIDNGETAKYNFIQ